MIRQNPRENAQRAFARMWPERNEPPRRLPNGRDFTDTRGSIRANIRLQRATIAYYAQMFPHLTV